MMRFWRARTPGPAATASSLAGSIVAHVVLVGAAVAASQRDHWTDEPVPENSIVHFLAPPNRAASPAAREVVRYVIVGIPEGAIADAPAVGVVQSSAPSRVSPVEEQPESPPRAGFDSVFQLVDVDSAAERYEWSAAPAFPATMLEQGQSGFVRAEWVVDERGIPDTLTFRVIEASHPDFEQAVRDALPFMRFRPARIGNRTVSQLVQQPFNFRFQRPDTARSPVPPR